MTFTNITIYVLGVALLGAGFVYLIAGPAGVTLWMGLSNLLGGFCLAGVAVFRTCWKELTIS